MLQTLWATVHDGQIQLSEHVALPEGAKLIVTVLLESHWPKAIQSSLDKIWDNPQDDVYSELLSP